MLQNILGIARILRGSATWEYLKALYQIIAQVSIQVVCDQNTIIVVCHVAAIHDVAKDVAQIVPRNFWIVFEIVHPHLRAGRQVAKIEGIAAIPTLWSKLLALHSPWIVPQQAQRF